MPLINPAGFILNPKNKVCLPFEILKRYNLYLSNIDLAIDMRIASSIWYLLQLSYGLRTIREGCNGLQK